MATIRDKVGHLETLPIDPLNMHLDASFIFQSLGYNERWSKLFPEPMMAYFMVFSNLQRVLGSGAERFSHAPSHARACWIAET
jgi:hypothetical protein